MTRPQLVKVMVVDDRPENLLAMRSVLADIDVEVVCANSGIEALSLLIDNQFAVILLDVQMPDMDGFETATLIRGNEATGHVPIIFVTATRPDEEGFSDGYSAGAVDYLTKPINEEVLRAKVGVFLELDRQRLAMERQSLELEVAQEELRRSNGALREFAGAAAHDLKAPVRHIRAWIDMLIEDEGDSLSEDAVEKLNGIEESAMRMNRLISGLLGYAQVSASPPEMSDIPLEFVLEDVLTDLRDNIEEAAAEIRVNELPTVTGNDLLLCQLFQNLIGNALKYRRPGVAPLIEIACEVEPAKGFCDIAITDNGIGFDQTRAKLIFEPFQRLVGASEFDGSGIGMATAKRIVDLHGGAISASGEMGVGATFTVTLPLAKLSADQLHDQHREDMTDTAGARELRNA